MSTATLDKPDRAEWLAARKLGIGASDTPAILGIDPYRTALDVYVSKIDDADDADEMTLPQEIGLFMEPFIAAKYEQATGRRIVDSQVCVADDDHPFIRATLDGITECGRVVEFKTTHSHAKGLEIGEEGTDEIPMAWLLQVTHQLIASGKCIADVAILRGNSKFTVHTVEYNDELASVIVDACRDFWQRVQDRNPPPATRGSDVRVLAKLYPEAEGETALGDVGEYLVKQWEAANTDAKLLGDMAAKYKAQLLAELAGYQTARLADGRILKRSVVEVRERTQTVKAHTQVRLSISKGEQE
jgi:putative phage-type endonuclease